MEPQLCLGLLHEVLYGFINVKDIFVGVLETSQDHFKLQDAAYYKKIKETT